MKLPRMNLLNMRPPRPSRKWLLVPLVAGALVVGIGAGALITASAATALAHGKGGGHGFGQSSGFAARVAGHLTSILGLETAITESQVQTAFNAAYGDRQEEQLQARLDQLEVEDATATAVMDWFNAYPYADLIRLRPIGLADSDQVSNALDKLVEKERITQTQSDGIQSWYDDRPDLPAGLERSGKGDRDGRRGHHRRGDKDGNGSQSDDDGDANTRFRGGFGWGGRGHRGNSM